MLFITYDKLVFFLEWREEQNSVCGFHGLQHHSCTIIKTQKFQMEGRTLLYKGLGKVGEVVLKRSVPENAIRVRF